MGDIIGVVTIGHWFKMSHGIGDAINMLYALEMHKRRGFRYRGYGWCPEATWPLTAYCDTVRHFDPNLPDGILLGWKHHVDVTLENVSKPWTYNEMAVNICMSPLNSIGDDPKALWDELITIRPRLPNPSQHDIDKAKDLLGNLPRPIILLHPRGWSYKEKKNIPLDQVSHFANSIADATGGSVAIFNHYNDLEKPTHDRVILLPAESVGTPFSTVMELIKFSDLLVGIDSGPLHLARITDTPTVGIWMSRHSYPTRYTLPGPKRLNLVPDAFDDWTSQIDRDLWDIRSGGETTVTPEMAAKFSSEILKQNEEKP